jgi:error-prone DNA polymerase
VYIELHARSAFSFLEGSSLPEDMVEVCAHLNMPAMALLDRDGVYGSPRFHLAANKAKIKAHIGAEVTCNQFQVADCQLPIANCSTSRKSAIEHSFRLPLLASSRLAYQNLCRLITRMKLRNKKEEGALFEHELEEHAPGLICLTGGDDGLLATALARGGFDEALGAVERLTQIFGRNNVYIELQRHFHREEEARNRAAVEIANTLKLPLSQQWCLLCHSARSRTCRCIHVASPSLHVGHGWTASRTQFRASSEIASTNAASLHRPSPSSRQYA